MMNFLGTILGLLSIVVFIWACVGLFAPARAKLSSRWQSVLVWGVSFILLLASNAALQQSGSGVSVKPVAQPSSAPQPPSVPEAEPVNRTGNTVSQTVEQRPVALTAQAYASVLTGIVARFEN